MKTKIKNCPFTLIDLLVVIAIIGILIGMMLPSLMKAQRKALQIACISQLRQQYLAVLQYVDDSQDQLPEIVKTDPRIITAKNGLGRLIAAGYLPGKVSGKKTKPRLFRCTVPLGSAGWFDSNDEGSDYHLTRDCSSKEANGVTAQFTCFNRRFSLLSREILVRCMSTGVQLDAGLHENNGTFSRVDGSARAIRSTIYRSYGNTAQKRLAALDDFF